MAPVAASDDCPACTASVRKPKARGGTSFLKGHVMVSVAVWIEFTGKSWFVSIYQVHDIYGDL